MATRKFSILESLVFLLLILLARPRIAAKKEENCSYTLEVKTSCGLHVTAGTDDHVRVRFWDKSFDEKGKGEVLERHLSQSMNEGQRKPFQRCETDNFELTGPCMEGNVCYLFFKLEEGKDNWRIEHAKVHSLNGTAKFHFEHKLTKKRWYGRDYCKIVDMLPSNEDMDTVYSREKSNPKPKKTPKGAIKSPK